VATNICHDKHNNVATNTSNDIFWKSTKVAHLWHCLDVTWLVPLWHCHDLCHCHDLIQMGIKNKNNGPQNFCSHKIMFVATNICHDKHNNVATNTSNDIFWKSTKVAHLWHCLDVTWLVPLWHCHDLKSRSLKEVEMGKALVSVSMMWSSSSYSVQENRSVVGVFKEQL